MQNMMIPDITNQDMQEKPNCYKQKVSQATFKGLQRGITGVILELSEREKFCDNFRISGRSFGPNFRFPYTFYTFSLLSQLKIGRSQPA